MEGRDVTHTEGGTVTVWRLTEAAVDWASAKEADLDLNGFLGRYATDPLKPQQSLLSTPMGVDYVVIGFGMQVQPLVTHNAA